MMIMMMMMMMMTLAQTNLLTIRFVTRQLFGNKGSSPVGSSLDISAHEGTDIPCSYKGVFVTVLSTASGMIC